jgi:hypothetical protein
LESQISGTQASYNYTTKESRLVTHQFFCVSLVELTQLETKNAKKSDNNQVASVLSDGKILLLPI